MTTDNYTCFVSSPVVSGGSNDVKYTDTDHFNTVKEYLIIPALKQAGFQSKNVFFAEEARKINSITNDIKNHLEQDDLCIANLTGMNHNVLYEFGVRIGLNKAVIPIVDKKTILPADIQGMHIIVYDIETTKGLMEAQKKLARAVLEITSEFSTTQKHTANSFSALSDRLQVIEEKLNVLLSNSPHGVEANLNDYNTNIIIRDLGGVIPAFNYALRNKDVMLGEKLLPRLKTQLEEDQYYFFAVSQLAAIGSRIAGKDLKDNWDYITQNYTLSKQTHIIGCYISYCNFADLELQELEFVATELDRLEKQISASDLSTIEKNELLSSIYNQINRIYFGAYSTAAQSSESANPTWLEKAVDSLNKAIILKPDEPSFYFNLATCYNRLGSLSDAEKAIRKCLSLGTTDRVHLQFAYDLFMQIGEKEEAQKVKTILAQRNPYAASML